MAFPAIKYLALRLAASKPAPDLIPRSGPDAKGVDCYVASISGSDGTWGLLVAKPTRRGVSGKWLENRQFEAPCSVPWANLGGATFEFAHFVGPYEFRHASTWQFLVSEILNIYRFSILRDRAEQFFFNRTRLARTERIDALKQVLERTLTNPRYYTSATTFMTDVYTVRWVFHPEKDKLLAYYALLLDSLVDSGDLSKDGITYKLAPHALSTLATYEEEDRRHKDNVDQQRALKWLTLLLALFAFGQLLWSKN